MEAKAEEFGRKRKEAMQKLMDKAVEKKEEIRNLDAVIATKQKDLERLETERAEAAKEAGAAKRVLEEMYATPRIDLREVEREIRSSAEFKKMAIEEVDLQSQANALQLKTVSASDLLADRKGAEAEVSMIRREYEEKVRPLRDKLAVNGERERVLRLIAEEEKREKAFADEVARLERLEFRASEYVKAEIDAQESAINALFRVARWKMFDRTIEGGIVEMCEVTSEEGVPFRSMNDAKKILCGLDVIRVFSERYDCLAPIFVDNAESITKKTFDTEAQVVRLVVSEGSELTMIHE